jgi:L-2-hydroxyglutarate oxidase LhgO
MTKNHQSSKLTKKNYDLVIIGAGITGTALLYTLTNYTNINSIAFKQ